ncbi:MAG: hypothetical protein RSA70_06515, partial [Clostridia bacterium]
MKNRIIGALLCLAVLISVGGAAFASDNAETVYVIMNANGQPHEIIVKNNGVETKNVKGELPFNAKISYQLGGKAVAPQDILGKSGDVKIKVEITANPKTKAYYKENLALQMQIPIDISDNNASNIVSTGLTDVTVGGTKTFSAIVLPGKSAKYEISYKTKCFEMQSCSFACMPFDIKGTIDIDVTTIKNQVKELQNGVDKYVNGVKDAGAGVSDVSAGLRKLAANGKTLLDGYNRTTSGESALIAAMLSTMPPQQQQMFIPKIQAIQAGQKSISSSLSAYIGGVSKTSAGLRELNAGMSELSQNGNTLKNGVNTAVAPINKIPGQNVTTIAAESFISANKVREIQFVMKTDAMSATKIKEDVTSTEKPKKTFWDR